MSEIGQWRMQNGGNASSRTITEIKHFELNQFSVEMVLSASDEQLEV